MTFKIPIVVKLIFITVLILAGATAVFVKTSTDKLTKTLQMREEDSNRFSAKAKASEVDRIITALAERVQLNANLLFASYVSNRNITNQVTTSNAAQTAPSVPALPAKIDNPMRQLEINFGKDPHLLALDIYDAKDFSHYLDSKKNEASVAKTPGLDDRKFKEYRNCANVSKIAQKNLEISNLTVLNAKCTQDALQTGSRSAASPAVISIGLPFLKGPDDSVTHVAIAYYSLAAIQTAFSEETERTFFVVDKAGYLLGHSDETKVMQKLNMREYDFQQKGKSGNNIIDTALMTGAAAALQTSGIELETNQEWYVAYMKNMTWGTVVVSAIQKSIVLEPSRDVKVEAIRSAGYMIAVAILIITVFALMLVAPLEKLAELIQSVAKGNFNVKARSVVHSADEVGELAIVFDHMTEGLKERDKVKNLFNKFHGSTVAEDLLKRDIQVGGQNKEVTVFFSDIRGFTKFSEGKRPEEVVEMLNEYFEVMVKIITNHGGVVDKFIGDAIMAVWGAPQTTPKDTHNAVMACMQMRKALDELNKKRGARNQDPIKIGMGLHAGRAISGTIGSSERMEYTVIGDTVNMTSRIEASTKSFGTDLLVSQYVVDKVGDSFLMNFAGAAEVKGITEPLRLYKVKAYKDPATGQFVEITTKYSEYEAEAADKVKIAG